MDIPVMKIKVNKTLFTNVKIKKQIAFKTDDYRNRGRVILLI